MILLTLVACQPFAAPAPTAPLPTLFILPTTTPSPRPVQAIPTQPPTASPSAGPTLTDTATPAPTASVTPTATASPTPAPTARALLPEAFLFGRSVQGRDLLARRLGAGDRYLLVLVGGIHGGFESNTVTLMEELIDHFTRTPQDILPGFSVLIVPVLNPDGLTAGRSLAGRFNANRVDLNRNWDCGWQAEAFFRQERVSAGDAPFSEPEALAMAALIVDLQPDAVLFYHSAVDGVFPGDCGGDAGSAEMSAVYGRASGYRYGMSFSAYPVTGTAPAWVNAQGIPSADVELASARDTEFSRNLRGVIAVQCWLLGDDAQRLAPAQCGG